MSGATRDETLSTHTVHSRTAGDSGPALTQLFNQLCHENQSLYGTVASLFHMQERLIALRAARSAPEAAAGVQALLEEYVKVALYQVLEWTGPEDRDFALVYHSAFPGPRAPAPPAATGSARPFPGSADPFSDEEVRTTLERADVLIKSVATTPPGSPFSELRTAALAPLVADDEVVGLLLLGLQSHDGALTRFHRAMVRYLARELASLLGQHRCRARDTGAAERLGSAAQQRLAALRSEILTGIVHDLNTPLTAILSASEILRLSAPELGAEQLETLSVIEASANRLQTLSADLREFSTLARGAAEDSLVVIDLAGLVEEVAPLSARGETRRVQIEPAPTPVSVRCQPERMRRVVENLVLNALKYSPSGGQVWVSVDRADGEARLQVRDEGMGFAEGESRRLQERFEHASAAGDAPCVGLGLSLVNMIVERHGGRVTVESKLGEGSTFSVFLPLVRCASAPAERVP